MNVRNIKPHQSYLNHDDRLGEHPVLTGVQILAVVSQWCGGGETVDLEEYAPIRLVTGLTPGSHPWSRMGCPWRRSSRRD